MPEQQVRPGRDRPVRRQDVNGGGENQLPAPARGQRHDGAGAGPREEILMIATDKDGFPC